LQINTYNSELPRNKLLENMATYSFSADGAIGGYDSDLLTAFDKILKPKNRSRLSKQEVTQWRERDIFPDSLKGVPLRGIKSGIYRNTPYYERRQFMTEHIAPVVISDKQSWTITVPVKGLDLAKPTALGVIPTGFVRRVVSFTQATRRFAIKGEQWHINALLPGGMQRQAEITNDMVQAMYATSIQFSIQCMLRTHGYNLHSINALYHATLGGVDQYWAYRKKFFNIIAKHDRPMNEIIPAMEDIQKYLGGSSDCVIIARNTERKVRLDKPKHTDAQYTGGRKEGFDGKVNDSKPVDFLMGNKIFALQPHVDSQNRLDDPLLNVSVELGEYHVAGCRTGVTRRGALYSKHEMNPLIYDETEDMNIVVDFEDMINCSGMFNSVHELEKPDFHPISAGNKGSGYPADLKMDFLSKDDPKDPTKRIKIDVIGETGAYEPQHMAAFTSKFLSRFQLLNNEEILEAGYSTLDDIARAPFDIRTFTRFCELNISPDNIVDLPDDRFFSPKQQGQVKILKATDSTGSFYKLVDDAALLPSTMSNSIYFGCHSLWGLDSIAQTGGNINLKKFTKSVKAMISTFGKLHPRSEILDERFTPSAVPKRDVAWAWWSNLISNNSFMWVNVDYSSSSNDPLVITVTGDGRFALPSHEIINGLLQACPHVRRFVDMLDQPQALSRTLQNELAFCLRSSEPKEISKERPRSSELPSSPISVEDNEQQEYPANMEDQVNSSVDNDHETTSTSSNSSGFNQNEDEAFEEITYSRRAPVPKVVGDSELPTYGRVVSTYMAEQMSGSGPRFAQHSAAELLALLVTVRILRISYEKTTKEKNGKFTITPDQQQKLNSESLDTLRSLAFSAGSSLYVVLAAIERVLIQTASQEFGISTLKVLSFLITSNPSYAFEYASDESRYIESALTQFSDSFSAFETTFVLDYFGASRVGHSIELDKIGEFYDPRKEYGNLYSVVPENFEVVLSSTETTLRANANRYKAKYVPPYFRSQISLLTNQKVYIDALLRILGILNNNGTTEEVRRRLNRIQEIMAEASNVAECVTRILRWVTRGLTSEAQSVQREIAKEFFLVLGNSNEDVMLLIKDIESEIASKKLSVQTKMKKINALHGQFQQIRAESSKRVIGSFYVLTALTFTSESVVSLYSYYKANGYYGGKNSLKEPIILPSSHKDPLQKGTLRDLEIMYEQVVSAESGGLLANLRTVGESVRNRLPEFYYGSMLTSQYDIKSSSRDNQGYLRRRLTYLKRDTLASKELDRKFNGLASIISDPIALSVARANALTPFNEENILTMLRNDLIIPFEMYLFKCWMRYMAYMVVKLKGIQETASGERVGGTGFISFGGVVFAINSDAGAMDNLQHLSAHTCFVTTNPENLYIAHDAHIVGRRGGASTELFDMRNFTEHGTDYLDPKADLFGHGCSMLPVPAPIGTASSILPLFLDITGRPHNLVEIGAAPPEALETPMYPSCYRACSYWGIVPKTKVKDVSESRITDTRTINTECLRGQTRYWNYVTNSYTDDNMVTSHSLWGEECTYPGCQEARAGNKDFRRGV